MRTFSLGPERARQIDRYGSDFALTRLLRSAALHVACLRLPPGGRGGAHATVRQQLFAVVEGEGCVRGDAEQRAIHAGEAAFWEPGERHAVTTQDGLAASIIEGDVLAAAAQESGPVG